MALIAILVWDKLVPYAEDFLWPLDEVVDARVEL
jgi:hypothetical protein